MHCETMNTYKIMFYQTSEDAMPIYKYVDALNEGAAMKALNDEFPKACIVSCKGTSRYYLACYGDDDYLCHSEVPKAVYTYVQQLEAALTMFINDIEPEVFLDRYKFRFKK